MTSPNFIPIDQAPPQSGSVGNALASPPLCERTLFVIGDSSAREAPGQYFNNRKQLPALHAIEGE